MFLPLDLLAAPVQAAGAIGIVATLAGILYALRRKIPHPTEFRFIGFWFRLFGCHDHDPFDLILDVQSASNCPPNRSLYAFAKCGRFEDQTEPELSNNTGEVEWYQRLPLHVRQKDNHISLELYEKGPLGSDCVGSLDYDVVLNLGERPVKRTLTLQRNNQNASRISVNFYKVQPLPAAFQDSKLAAWSQLVQQALIQSQLDGQDIDPHLILTMDDDHRIAFFGKVIEGPLRMLRQELNPRWESAYFKATTTTSGAWVWCGWSSKQTLAEKKNPRVAIPIVAVRGVFRQDSDPRDQFNLRYEFVDKDGSRSVRHVVLKRVDRDRDLWINGLYQLVQMVRDARERRAGGSKASKGGIVEVMAETEKLNSTQAPRSPIPSGQVTPAQESPRPQARRRPVALEAMAAWLNDPGELDEEVNHMVDLSQEHIRLSVEEDQEEAPFLPTSG